MMSTVELRRTWLSNSILTVLACSGVAAGMAVSWLAGPTYGIFLIWASLALVAFVVSPAWTMAGLMVLRIAASDWAESLVLFQGAPYNINHAGLANLVLLGLAGVYMVWKRPKIDRLAWAFAAFLAAGLISIPFSVSPLSGLRDWSRLAPLLGIYIIWADVLRASLQRTRLLLWTVIAASAVPAGVALYQWATGSSGYVAGGVTRLLGTLGHPIGYGTFLGIVFLAALLLVRSVRNRAVQVALALWAALSLALLFLTYSRGPLLALVAGLLVAALFAIREPLSLRLGLVVLSFGLIVTAILGGRTEDLERTYTYRALTPRPAYTPAPQPTPAPTQPSPGTAVVPNRPGPTSFQPTTVVYGVNSFSWRLNLWRYGFDLAKKHPITGIGLGSFPSYSPAIVGWDTMPHNDFVRAFTEMGFLGFVTYLLLWGVLAWNLIAMWRKAGSGYESLLAATLLGIAAVYAVNGLSADMLNYPALGWLFWSLAAIPVAYLQRSEP